MSGALTVKSQGVYGEAMKLDGNAEQVLDWMTKLGDANGEPLVFWDIDDFGRIYFSGPSSFSGPTSLHAAGQGEYVALCADGHFRSFSQSEFDEQFEVIP